MDQLRKTLLPTPDYAESWAVFRHNALGSTGYSWPHPPTFIRPTQTTGPTSIEIPSSHHLRAPPKRGYYTNNQITRQFNQRLRAPPKRENYNLNQPIQHFNQRRINTRVNTANKDFEQLIRTIYKTCQLNHHARTWKTFPTAIKRQLETVF